MSTFVKGVKPAHLFGAVGVFFIACAIYAGLWYTPQSASGGQVTPSDDPIYAEFAPPFEGAPIFADYPYYESVGEMKRKADVIVRGTVLSAKARDINISGERDREENPIIEACWVSTVRIEKVIKGDVSAGDIVEVKQLITDESIGMGVVGSEGVLLLSLYPHVPASPLTPYQGVVPIVDGIAQPRRGDHTWWRGLTEDQFIARLKSAR